MKCFTPNLPIDALAGAGYFSTSKAFKLPLARRLLLEKASGCSMFGVPDGFLARTDSFDGPQSGRRFLNAKNI